MTHPRASEVGTTYDACEAEHTLAGHPEHAGRLEGSLRLLRGNGLLEQTQQLPIELCSSDRLLRVHPRQYLEHVLSVIHSGGGQLDADTYVLPQSHRAALASAGAMTTLLDALAEGRIQRGFSLMRPPGHHALANAAMGFCIYANVAIAARAAQREHGWQRVLIVDWDVHHGNGTEAIFYDDPDVAFFSTHQHPFYPGTGKVEDTGRGAGEGATLNVPLPASIGDDGYLQLFDQLLTPFAERFEPDIILVSAGYDAHWRDPLASESLTLNGFTELTRRVRRLADRLCSGRLLLALEGGYDLEVLPYAISNSLRVLLDVEAAGEDPFGAAPHSLPVPAALIREIAARHRLL